MHVSPIEERNFNIILRMMPSSKTIGPVCRFGCLVARSSRRLSSSAKNEEQEPWKDPYSHALSGGKRSNTHTDFREASVDWNYVRRLMPRKLIPEAPPLDGAETPSGWRAPRDVAPDLRYYIRRGANHLPCVFLERRRDELNPKTMNFEYVELVILKNIEGDVFACERDLRVYLEHHLDHPVATHVDELKGTVRVKGADRTLVEQFVYDQEVDFGLLRERGLEEAES